MSNSYDSLAEYSEAKVAYIEKLCAQNDIELPGDESFSVQEKSTAAYLWFRYKSAASGMHQFVDHLMEGPVNTVQDKNKPERWLTSLYVLRAKKLLLYDILVDMTRRHSLKLQNDISQSGNKLPLDYVYLYQTKPSDIKLNGPYAKDHMAAVRAKDNARKHVDAVLSNFDRNILSIGVRSV